MLVRAATISDAAAIARIHVDTWRAAYRGHGPDSVLANLSVERREAFWRERLTQEKGAVFVAEEKGSVIGFCDLIPSRDADADAQVVEIAAIYIEPASWRKGAGGALCKQAFAEAQNRGCKSITLWVLTTNTAARHFYERIGFVPDGSSKTDKWPDGSALSEVRYRISIQQTK
ncbi:MAG TPA: GNAT family N-acetyltransferase [Verrucomicrobiae bacterium]|nr:GNAT family N-acetyltransferase [Verrucomicrobiae bacterium]